jgi:hypothetical protein
VEDDAEDPGSDDPEGALRVAVLLGVERGPGLLLLAGAPARQAERVVHMVEGIEVVALHAGLRNREEVAGVSRCFAGPRFPFFDALFRGTALGAGFTMPGSGYGTGVNSGVVLREVLAKVRKFHVRVDVNYATLLINMLCLEGLASALLPSYNILDRARPLLAPHSIKIIRPFFRKLYPLLLSFKRHSDSAVFNVLKKTGNVQQPPPAGPAPRPITDGSTPSPLLPANPHAPRMKEPLAPPSAH